MIILICDIIRFAWRHQTQIIEVKYQRNSGPEFIVKKSSTFLKKLKIMHPELDISEIVSNQSFDSEIGFPSSKNFYYIRGNYIKGVKTDTKSVYPVLQIDKMIGSIYYWGSFWAKFSVMFVLIFMTKKIW